MSGLDPTPSPSESHPPRSHALLADATHLGEVELTVADLDRSIAFYQDVIGLRVHERDGARATFGAGDEDLLVLHEDAQARRAPRAAGLYHYALLFPSRRELARVALRIAVSRTPIQGASDHGTHEAIYLPDPDDHGIELAADFPPEQWPDIRGPGGYGAGPARLDLDELLGSLGDEDVVPRADPGLRMGHVHLHVGDVDAATRFYRDGLGFEVVTDLGTAVFVSAGGYHHHVGFNVWRGLGVAPEPRDAIGLRHWTLVVPDAAELDAVRRRLGALGAEIEDHPDGLLARDPAGIAVLVRVER